MMMYMKRLLMITCVLLGVTMQTRAQVWPCEPNPDFNYSGIYPPQIPFGMAGYDYRTVLSFKIPRDSSISGVTVTVDSTRFVGASGIPNGFTFYCDKPSCTWIGGSKGCALFAGKVDSTFVVNADSSFRFKIYTETYYRFGASTSQFSRIDSSTNYIFKIRRYSGLIDIRKATPLSIYPNPTEGICSIQMDLLPADGGQLELTDVTGKLLLSQYIDKQSVSQQYDLSLSGFPKGIYVLKLSTSDGLHTARIFHR